MTKKVTQARKGLGTNSVGLATELSLVSKLLQKVIPKKNSAGGTILARRAIRKKANKKAHNKVAERG